MASLSAEKAVFSTTRHWIEDDLLQRFRLRKLSGMSLPDENGDQYVWDDAYVANLYDIDEDSFKTLDHGLAISFSTSSSCSDASQSIPVLPMPITHWLFGFSDLRVPLSDSSLGSAWKLTRTRPLELELELLRIQDEQQGNKARGGTGVHQFERRRICDYDYDESGVFLGGMTWSARLARYTV